MDTRIKDVETYIGNFPEETQVLLLQLKNAILAVAPEAEEVISYGMPGYKCYGVLVYFAGYKHHIGFYPGSSGISAFKKEIKAYKLSKGTVQLPLDKPLPVSLIKKIVKFRLAENLRKAKARTL